MQKQSSVLHSLGSNICMDDMIFITNKNIPRQLDWIEGISLDWEQGWYVGVGTHCFILADVFHFVANLLLYSPTPEFQQNEEISQFQISLPWILFHSS